MVILSVDRNRTPAFLFLHLEIYTVKTSLVILCVYFVSASKWCLAGNWFRFSQGLEQYLEHDLEQ